MYTPSPSEGIGVDFHGIDDTAKAVSNQLTFSPNASWNSNATTLASTIGSLPYVLFVNFSSGTIQVSIQQTSSSPISPLSLFVTDDEEIFVDNGSPFKRVERWTSNRTRLASSMFVSTQCRGLFMDSNNDISNVLNPMNIKYCAALCRVQS